jgi:hypothetical protein
MGTGNEFTSMFGMVGDSFLELRQVSWETEQDTAHWLE